MRSKQIYLLFKIFSVKNFLNSAKFLCPYEISKIARKHSAILFCNWVWGEWVQRLLWRLARKVEYLMSSHFIKDDAIHLRKVHRNSFQKCYWLLQQYARFKERYMLYNFLAMIDWWYNKDENDGWFWTIEELSLKIVLKTFKWYFQNFLLLRQPAIWRNTTNNLGLTNLQ